MAFNLVLGMGGTGAKLVEAYVHLCAAGFGPEDNRDTHIGLIEQDASNGITARAILSITRYMKLRSLLRGPESGKIPDDLQFLKPQLKWAVEDSPSWWPNDAASATLADVVSLNLLQDGAPELISSLFSDADGNSPDAELKMRLEQGYRARPHVGSLALLYAMERSQWWEALTRNIKAGSNDGLRVFLFASAFGGTGAAFFPTLAREIRNFAKANGIHRVSISGTLMTPYFTFPPPEAVGNVARPEDMAIQTKAALADYAHMVDLAGDARVFDNLYIVGNEPESMIAKFAAGGDDQNNAPLAPELIGALAAAREMSSPLRMDVGSEKTRVLLTARSVKKVDDKEAGNERAVDFFDWKDLPPVGADVSVQARVGQLLRFAWQWKYNFSSHLATQGRSGARHEAWYKVNLSKTPSDRDTAMIGATNDVVNGLLEYAVGLAFASNKTGQSNDRFFRLWDGSMLGSFDAGAPGAKPGLFESEGRSASEFNSVIEQVTAQHKFSTAPQIFRAVSDNPYKQINHGPARLVVTLYNHCSIRPVG